MCSPTTELLIEEFKQKKVEQGSGHTSFGREHELSRHIAMLKDEFSGKSYLGFFHAATIAFIRRGENLAHCLSNFNRMWAQEGEFLRAELDSRWLIAACDTIIDHGQDKQEVATAIAATLFMNTVKLYETEWLTQQKTREYDDVFATSLQVPLVDGLSAFLVGRGDMVQNLLARVKLADSPVAGAILQELVARANKHDTVFSRMRKLHTNPKTLW